MKFFSIKAAAFVLATALLSESAQASFSVSIGQFQKDEAERLHHQLALQGYPAYLLYGENCEVRMGSYPAAEEAEKVIEKLKTEQKVVGRIVEEEDWDQAQFNWNAEDDRDSKFADPQLAQGYTDPRAQKIISLGLDLFGHPYKYGGTRIGKGIDCSFFVQSIFKELGINLPRTSGEQFRVGESVAVPQLKVGDLVFFKKNYRIKRRKKSRNAPQYITSINHVGIYIGNGEFIHATLNVKRVTISRLDEQYFVKRFAGARRVLQETIQNY